MTYIAHSDMDTTSFRSSLTGDIEVWWIEDAFRDIESPTKGAPLTFCFTVLFIKWQYLDFCHDGVLPRVDGHTQSDPGNEPFPYKIPEES